MGLNSVIRILGALTVVLSVARVAYADRLIVWNVGQGSWSTVQSRKTCYHFDMGGESAPWDNIRSACSGRENVVLFSHWDTDHVSFIVRALKTLPNLCAAAKPFGTAPGEWKKREMALLPDCELERRASPVREIFKLAADRKSSNGKSRVFEMRGALFPGDSGAGEEKLWHRRVSGNKFLIAGHHGSNTATSNPLLKSLKTLRLVIVSARHEKYGHPGKKFSARIHARKLPLITTEMWGSVYVEL